MAVWISELEQKEKFSLGGEQGLRYSEYIKKINQTLKDRLPQDRIIRFAKQANAKSLEAGQDSLPSTDRCHDGGGDPHRCLNHHGSIGSARCELLI